MKLIAKLIYLWIVAIMGVFTILAALNADWKEDWLLLLSCAIFFLALTLSLVDIKKTLLALVAFLPTVIYFNNYKINPAGATDLLANQQLPLNLTSVLAVFIIFLGVHTILSNWGKIKKLPLRYILAIYSVYITISIFWSPDLGESLIGIAYFVVPFFSYIIAYCYFTDRKDTFHLALAAIISSTIPIIIGFGQIISDQLYYEPDSSLGRINSTFTHPNLFGLYLFAILAIILSIYFAKKNQKIINNKFLLLFTILAGLSILLTYSRVAWASLFLFILILSIIRRQLIIALAAIFPVVLVVAFSLEKIRFRVMDVFSEARYSSWATRKRIWSVAWQEIMENPFFGNGIGTSEIVIEKAKDWQGGTSLPHNDLILYWLELGIIGVILFFAYTFGAIYYAFQKYTVLSDEYSTIKIWGREFEINYKKFVFGIVAILLAMILAGIFESTSKRIVTQIILWSLLGSILAQTTKK